jgi:hypothetical protein
VSEIARLILAGLLIDLNRNRITLVEKIAREFRPVPFHVVDHNQRTTVANALGIEFRLFFGDAVVAKKSDQSACRSSHRSASNRPGDRTSRQQWPDTWDHHGDYTRGKPNHRSDERIGRRFRFRSDRESRPDGRDLVSFSSAGDKADLLVCESIAE